MDSLDFEVLQTCVQWLQAGVNCDLVTVIKTWGSSPRQPGALLGIAYDGRVIGSVSGGCIEDDLIAKMQQNAPDAPDAPMRRHLPERIIYGVSADEAHRFGLPCGGTVELLIEPMNADGDALAVLSLLLSQLAQQQLMRREVCLVTGKMRLTQAKPGVPDVLLDDRSFTALYGPRWRLLIIGAGPLSRFLAQMAQAMDYQVTVCDPREEYYAQWQVSGVAVEHAMPDDWIVAKAPDMHCAVVALTHDPKLDDLALMEALKSSAFYVGALGSKANNAKRRLRLLEFDLTPGQLDQLHGPIGLYIGSKTPAEIAISILAEITAVKNGVHWPRQHMMAPNAGVSAGTSSGTITA